MLSLFAIQIGYHLVSAFPSFLASSGSLGPFALILFCTDSSTLAKCAVKTLTRLFQSTSIAAPLVIIDSCHRWVLVRQRLTISAYPKTLPLFRALHLGAICG